MTKVEWQAKFDAVFAAMEIAKKMTAESKRVMAASNEAGFGGEGYVDYESEEEALASYLTLCKEAKAEGYTVIDDTVFGREDLAEMKAKWNAAVTAAGKSATIPALQAATGLDFGLIRQLKHELEVAA